MDVQFINTKLELLLAFLIYISRIHFIKFIVNSLYLKESFTKFILVPEGFIYHFDTCRHGINTRPPNKSKSFRPDNLIFISQNFVDAKKCSQVRQKYRVFTASSIVQLTTSIPMSYGLCVVMWPSNAIAIAIDGQIYAAELRQLKSKSSSGS